MTTQDVANIRRTTGTLDTLERQIGGEHARSAAIGYLRRSVLPLLEDSAPTGVRRDLYTAAASLCELIGWMSYDAELHHQAQSFFIQGLRLAKEAGDTAYGAYILTSMSH